MDDKPPKPKGWRRWLVIELAEIVFAGYLMMAYGLGRLLRATGELDASIRNLHASQDEASMRLERQTESLLRWTRWLVAVTVLLFVVTVLLLAFTIARR